MKRRPPRSTRTDTLFPYTTLFRSLSLRVEGRVLASNMDDFRAGADAFLARLPKANDLRTDQDFANADAAAKACADAEDRSEEHTSELQSLMRISYAVFCLTKKTISSIVVSTLLSNTHKIIHV